MELNEIRVKIDDLDNQILRLTEQRMKLSAEAAAYKKEHHLEIFSPVREAEILNNIRKKADPELLDADTAVFQNILSVSRNYQAELLHEEAPDGIPSVIRTERLILRPLDRKAAPAVFSLTSDPDVARYMRFDTQTDISEAEKLIDDMTSGSQIAYVILCETGEFAGIFSFSPEKEKPDEVGMRIFLGKNHWNKGYCSELLVMAKKFGKKILQASCLKAHVVSRNTGSCRSLEKAGFFIESKLTFPGLTGHLCVYRYNLTD